jgi:hypothetical protein
MKYFSDAFENAETIGERLGQEEPSVAEAVAPVESEGRSEQKKGSYEVGEYVEGKGVFLMTFVAGKRNKQRKECNIFAAPEDLDGGKWPMKNAWNFEQAAAELSKRKNWHGHDGEVFKDCWAFEDAFLEGTYKGGWFIPCYTMLGTLYENRDTRALKGTFVTDRSALSSFYWSSMPDKGGTVASYRFATGKTTFLKRSLWAHLRPCRAEPI